FLHMPSVNYSFLSIFFSHHTPTPEISTLSLHDALPISFLNHIRRPRLMTSLDAPESPEMPDRAPSADEVLSDAEEAERLRGAVLDRKSTRLNSSHVAISYAVFCLKKKNSSSRRI